MKKRVERLLSNLEKESVEGIEIVSRNPLKIKVEVSENLEELNGLCAEIFLDDNYEFILDDIGNNTVEELKSLSPDTNDMILLIIETSWADEFDINDSMLLSIRAAQDYIKKIEEFDGEFDFYIGTNQGMEMDSEDVLNALSFKIVSEEESDILINYMDDLTPSFDIFDSIDMCFSEEEELDYELDYEDEIISDLKKVGWEVELVNEDYGLYNFIDKSNSENSAYNQPIFFGEDIINYLKK